MTARSWTGDDNRDELGPDYTRDDCADCGARPDEPCDDDCRCEECARARALALAEGACWGDVLQLMLSRGWPFTKAAYLVAVTQPDTPDFPLDAELTRIPDELDGELPTSTEEYTRVWLSLPRPAPSASSATAASTRDPSRTPVPPDDDEQRLLPDVQQQHASGVPMLIHDLCDRVAHWQWVISG